ncbi:thiamine-phosphate kinase [Anaplasma bovis]|uniref:thiamine-phosphate kinase n=1 Tax=Anaplasma bovis TaxID=186733 RepID=UPI002FEFB586
MDELECINEYIRPLLSSGFPSEDDDAAYICAGKNTSPLIASHDIITEGVHFFSNTAADIIAKKALRVNISDMASMGALPYAYLLGLSLPKGISNEWWSAFSSGLREDNERYSIKLVGGDTVHNKSSYITIGITILGIPGANTLTRSGAKIGDFLYISGTIGDAALGLLAHNNPTLSGCEYIKSRYNIPEPRVKLGCAIVGIASSCIDISDGFLQDIGRICKLSNVGANIHFGDIPLSAEAQHLLSHDLQYMEYILAGGDDYELAFTIPPDKVQEFKQLISSTETKVTQVGNIVSETGIRLYDHNNEEMSLPSNMGYVHRF